MATHYGRLLAHRAWWSLGTGARQAVAALPRTIAIATYAVCIAYALKITVVG